MDVAFFSNRGAVGGGGAVDVAGPGMDVYSAWPMPKRYNRIAGTSMATPHVAGIAALIAQAKPDFSGAQILGALIQMAKEANKLPGLPQQDVGSGLVVAP
jgi:subtilisin family serine protease